MKVEALLIQWLLHLRPWFHGGATHQSLMKMVECTTDIYHRCKETRAVVMLIGSIMVPEPKTSYQNHSNPQFVWWFVIMRIRRNLQTKKTNNHLAEESNSVFCKHILHIVMKLHSLSFQLTWCLSCFTFIFSNSILKKHYQISRNGECSIWPHCQSNLFKPAISHARTTSQCYPNICIIQTMLISLMLYSKNINILCSCIIICSVWAPKIHFSHICFCHSFEATDEWWQHIWGLMIFAPIEFPPNWDLQNEIVYMCKNWVNKMFVLLTPANASGQLRTRPR